ncbi:hypothetical protein B7P43_G05730 [Cryptotermes secundus]|uniref:Cytoskeleton-associated protein 2 C-terminal domain-containing protein n=1 Tax=Cryptotermes secundus TaxID=105785 RepID=A0A2J7QTZ2_9NEOP|nr:uncharacterized protein LOC111865407 isoform X2 [Cryptotermes secundus]PNF32049.1 hypothetical protein B7P43_G05730 [Cryptotermes secundus]
MDITNSQQKHTKAYLRDQIMKWREERQSRLMARVLHDRQGKVSSAIFGTITSSDVNIGPTGEIPRASVASIVKSKPHRNPKMRPNVAPEVKHTIASKLRMIKANPLLEARGLVTRPSKNKVAENKASNLLAGRNTGQLNAFPSTSAVKSSLQLTASFKSSFSFKNTVKSIDSIANDKQSSGVYSASIKRCSSARRSLSADPPLNKSVFTEVGDTKNIRRIHSVANIPDLKNSVVKEETEELGGNDVIFPLTNTPQRAGSESLLKSSGKKGAPPPLLNVYTPTPDIMRKSLSDWLHKRGKSLGNFHHLHCFGLKASNMTHGNENFKQNRKPPTVNYGENKMIVVEENHTSNTGPSAPRSDQEIFASEEHTASSSPEEDKENVCAGNLDLLVQDAVKDLLNIVHIGYPWNQCEEWLTMIRRFCPGIKEVPIYWECVAALEEARGDFKSAVDCYERAIIRGASPTKVGDSLDQLMEKFNMLNLKCDLGNDGSTSVKTQRKNVLDARNVFKSSIIKFALQQKVLRSLSTNLKVEPQSLHYVVTPVRRSTRASLSYYRTTPRLQCVNSLKQLDSDVRKSMVFQPNPALES